MNPSVPYTFEDVNVFEEILSYRNATMDYSTSIIQGYGSHSHSDVHHATSTSADPNEQRGIYFSMPQLSTTDDSAVNPEYNFEASDGQNSVHSVNSPSGFSHWESDLDPQVQYQPHCAPAVLPPQYPTVDQQQNRVLPSGTCDCGCGGGPNVPQRVYKHPKTTFQATPYESKIVFITKWNVCGIPVRDVLEHAFGSLLGANEPVLRTSGTSISLRFEWPPSKLMSYTCQIRVQDWKKEPSPISRSKLATEIIKQLLKFISKMENENHHPNSLWRVGTGGITAADLVLVCLEQVGKASWQPHFRLV